MDLKEFEANPSKFKTFPISLLGRGIRVDSVDEMNTSLNPNVSFLSGPKKTTSMFFSNKDSLGVSPSQMKKLSLLYKSPSTNEHF